jgi:hypothetical protein
MLALGAACGAEQVGAGPRHLAEQLEIGSDWIELEPHPPLLVERPVSELVLHHAPSLTLTRGFGTAKNAIYVPKAGEMMLLEIELVDRDGSIELLEAAGISPGRLGMKPGEADLPEHFEATKLRLRSNRPLTISKLEWRARTFR